MKEGMGNQRLLLQRGRRTMGYVRGHTGVHLVNENLLEREPYWTLPHLLFPITFFVAHATFIGTS